MNDLKKLNPIFILVNPAMMSYEDMANLYQFYDISLIQLSPQVVLVYKYAKLFENAFSVLFIFEEIIHFMMETLQKGKHSWMVKKTPDHSWGISHNPWSYKY